MSFYTEQWHRTPQTLGANSKVEPSVSIFAGTDIPRTIAIDVHNNRDRQFDVPSEARHGTIIVVTYYSKERCSIYTKKRFYIFTYYLIPLNKQFIYTNHLYLGNGSYDFHEINYADSLRGR